MIENGIDLDGFCGNCPVQAEGTIDGCAAYFRARGSRWTLSIASGHGDPVGVPRQPGWVVSGLFGFDYQAGWMTPTQAAACVRAAVASWRDAGGASAPLGIVALTHPAPEGLDGDAS